MIRRAAIGKVAGQPLLSMRITMENDAVNKIVHNKPSSLAAAAAAGANANSTAKNNPKRFMGSTDRSFKDKEKSKNNTKGTSSKPSPSPSPSLSSTATKIKIESSNFEHFVQTCKAKRYKVHRPKCSCPKIKNIFRRSTSNNDNGNSDSDSDSLDGLVVVPDTTTNISSVFLLRDSPKRQFDKNPLLFEKRLHDIIFPPSPPGGGADAAIAATAATGHNAIKVSCANCLLEIVPNGFVCISSQSKATVEFVKKMAQKNQRDKIKHGIALHADHAEYLCTLQLKDLYEIQNQQRKKKRSKNKNVKDVRLVQNPVEKFLHSIREQGVPVPGPQSHDIKLGHHLASILALSRGKKHLTEESFIMVILMRKDKSNKIISEVDIPGGKRHLGEQTFDCARRETEEETSLVIDRTWISSGDERLFPQNQYYFALPPEGIMMESVVKDPFWTNTGKDSLE